MITPAHARVTDDMSVVIVRSVANKPMTYIRADVVKDALKMIGVKSDIDVLVNRALSEYMADTWKSNG